MRIEAGPLRITAPVADAIRIGDAGRTGAVELVDGSAGITDSSATHSGYDAGTQSTFDVQGGVAILAGSTFGRFAGGRGVLAIGGGTV